ncbi:TPA: hypothetical protein HA246_03875 [Candidatus Woesearchaeota archaeon]|nr:hypothetical protein [Candidatus Woesearchaeota archaeon]
MLKKDELRTLMLLFNDLNRNLTISDISRLLKNGYYQAYLSVYSLKKNGDVILEKIGNSIVVKPNLTKPSTNQALAEMERAETVCKNITLRIIKEKVREMDNNFVCVLFGSQVKKPSEKSDIDLLFIIPNCSDFGKFEAAAKSNLVAYNCDINITSEKGMLEMWSAPKKFNVANEVLSNHVVLYGAEHFLTLLRKHYKG